jgi:hypothetical protein
VSSVVVWIPHGELPADNGYVRLNSAKYGDCQVLVYEAAIDKTLLVKEQQLYQAWLDRQPPAVEKHEYEVTTGVKTREQPLGEGERLTCAEQWELELSRRLSSEEDGSDSGSSFSSSQSDEPISLGDAAELSGVVVPTQSPGAIATPSTGRGAPRQIHTAESMNSAVSVMHSEGLSDAKAEFIEQATRLKSTVDNDDSANHRFNELLQHEIDASEATFSDDPATDLELRFLAAMSTCEDAEAVDTDSAAAPLSPAEYEHSATEIDLEDYAHELAFMPDMTDLKTTSLDYTGSNVVSEAHTPAEQARLVTMLQTHEDIMISSGNALPPPAYGVVCDIDVEDHLPIKQRARRTPLKHLKKLYELLKGFLKAGLIAFSNSPWASPIVIVLKKNGVDIRLCIDYKMVNAITKLMEYAMPLVDDLLTELEHYLWFCSLDAASEFWAVMMTRRARGISAFVCALGHFEWLRMPFGLKNAPMIYQRLIDNALWGYVQPRGGWVTHAERVHLAESSTTTQREQSAERVTQLKHPPPNQSTKFEADHRAIAESDTMQISSTVPMVICSSEEIQTNRLWFRVLNDDRSLMTSVSVE